MKEFENIDDIFLKGLEGKSIEKPADYWKDISSNILNKISKPWWGALITIAIGITAVTAIVIIVWYNIDVSSTIQTEPKQVESTMTDTVAIKKDTPEESIPPTDLINSAPLQEVPQTEASELTEKQVVPGVPTPKRPELAVDSQALPESKDSIIVTQPDSARLNAFDSISTPKNQQLPPKELSKKKVPTVIIIQDTVIVTDTIKIEKKK